MLRTIVCRAKFGGLVGLGLSSNFAIPVVLSSKVGAKLGHVGGIGDVPSSPSNFLRLLCLTWSLMTEESSLQDWKWLFNQKTHNNYSTKCKILRSGIAHLEVQTNISLLQYDLWETKINFWYLYSFFASSHNYLTLNSGWELTFNVFEKNWQTFLDLIPTFVGF